MKSGVYYRRDGLPYEGESRIDILEQVEKDLGDAKTKRVARDVLPNGKVVSTVWLGLNHAWPGGPPLIFETMVFQSENDYECCDMERYSTDDEALEGHKKLVEKWK